MENEEGGYWKTPGKAQRSFEKNVYSVRKRNPQMCRFIKGGNGEEV